jgi:hypothetical protein
LDNPYIKIDHLLVVRLAIPVTIGIKSYTHYFGQNELPIEYRGTILLDLKCSNIAAVIMRIKRELGRNIDVAPNSNLFGRCERDNLLISRIKSYI